ncbi:DUF6531 domain-containing protein, partial [bacterium]|nr:DUF6531 domain-containing protein [bacterium]
PLYRSYKHEDRDHFYCTSENHLDVAANQGYDAEGVEGFVSNARFNDTSMTELFRLYSDDLDSHFYVDTEAEADSLVAAGLRYEGIVGYAYDTAQPGVLPLTPLYHLVKDNGPADHDNFFTVSEVERAQAQSLFGYVDHGILAYVSPTGDLVNRLRTPFSILLGHGLSPGTGSFRHYTTPGFDIPSVGLPLTFSHNYNSNAVHLLTQARPLGPGWSHTYNACVVTIPGERLVIWPDGELHRYSTTGVCLDREIAVYDEMTVLPNGRFEVRKKNQVVYAFEPVPGAPADYPAMLASIRDRNGNQVTCSYADPDGLHRLTTVTGTAGRTLTFQYHDVNTSPERAHLLVSVTESSASRTVTFAYEPSTDALVSYTDCAGQVTTYEYEADPVLGAMNHQLGSIQLPRNNRIDNTYADRRATGQNWADGGSLGALTLQYTPSAGTVNVINAVGESALLTFDPHSRILSVQDAEGTVSVERLDPQNPALPTEVQDRRGYSTTYQYDSRGNPLRITQPGTRLWEYVYDTQNNVRFVTDPESHQTEYRYDAAGNLTSIIDPSSRTTTITRLSNGLPQYVYNPLTHRTTFSFNSYGDLLSVADQPGNTTTYGYDNISGNATSKT